MGKSPNYMKRYRQKSGAGGGGVGNSSANSYTVTANSYAESFENVSLTNGQVSEIENQRRDFYNQYKRYGDILYYNDEVELDKSTQRKYNDLKYGSGNSNMTRYSYNTLQDIKRKAKEDLGYEVRRINGHFFPAADGLKSNGYTTNGYEWRKGVENIKKYDGIIKSVDDAMKKKVENAYKRRKRQSQTE